jgi:hypothetical protein
MGAAADLKPSGKVAFPRYCRNLTVATAVIAVTGTAIAAKVLKK